MKFLIVIATLAVSCIAAPNPSDTSYVRPTSINPSVLSESKPVDTTTSIADQKEVNNYKLETSKPFHPTALPEEVHHHLSKRDHKPDHDSLPVTKPKVPELPKKTITPQPPKKSVLNTQSPSSTKLPVPKRNRRNAQTMQQNDDVAAIALQKPQTLPDLIHKDGPKVIPTTQPNPSVPHHENNSPDIALQKPQTLPHVIHKDETKVLPTTQPKTSPDIALQKPQALPAIIHGSESKNPLKTPAVISQQHKRDIPVPLVAKHKHPEDSSKDSSSEENSKEDSGEQKTDKKEEIKQIATPHNDNVQVEDLTEPKPVNKHTLSTIKHPHEFHPQRDHIGNTHSISEEQKPVTIGDVQQKPNANKVAAESTTSTDEHPLIRPKPVPVAELFSRHHDN